MPETTVEIRVAAQAGCNDLKLSIDHGDIVRTDVCRYRVFFHQARGGKTLLFGKVIKDKSPQTRNYVVIKSESTNLVKLSYDDIMELPFEIDSLFKVYQVRI